MRGVLTISVGVQEVICQTDHECGVVLCPGSSPLVSVFRGGGGMQVGVGGCWNASWSLEKASMFDCLWGCLFL